jgi:hypothetical protein
MGSSANRDIDDAQNVSHRPERHAVRVARHAKIRFLG